MSFDDLRQLVARLRDGEGAENSWRFSHRKGVAIGDRAFLLLQGRRGPAIIGHGRVIGQPQNISGKWLATISFEQLTDPSKELLADRKELLAIADGERLWRTQSSGVKLPQGVAESLEKLVVGRPIKP
jgi:hypothetical protein